MLNVVYWMHVHVLPDSIKCMFNISTCCTCTYMYIHMLTFTYFLFCPLPLPYRSLVLTYSPRCSLPVLYRSLVLTSSPRCSVYLYLTSHSSSPTPRAARHLLSYRSLAWAYNVYTVMCDVIKVHSSSLRVSLSSLNSLQLLQSAMTTLQKMLLPGLFSYFACKLL